MKLKIFTDGGARGNPGPAAIGILIQDENGETILEHGETIGEATNNVAEYRALIEGLKQAHVLHALEIDCHLDSELVVKQLRGEYRLKNLNLKKLFDEVRKIESNFSKVCYRHLRREDERIQQADRLVNDALDQAKNKRLN